MFGSKLVLFQKTKELNAKITEFLNNISEAEELFEKAADTYFLRRDYDEFDAFLDNVAVLEARNDQLRRSIEAALYEHTLIPESRADVLELLEGLDNVLNLFEAQMYQISIEKPKIYEQFSAFYLNLVESITNAVESLLRAARAFFTNPSDVNEHIQKVMFFEKQSDMIGTKLKRAIFADKNIELSHKIQLRMLCDDIDGIADASEDVADRLSIYVIKRYL